MQLSSRDALHPVNVIDRSRAWCQYGIDSTPPCTVLNMLSGVSPPNSFTLEPQPSNHRYKPMQYSAISLLGVYVQSVRAQQPHLAPCLKQDFKLIERWVQKHFDNKLTAFHDHVEHLYFINSSKLELRGLLLLILFGVTKIFFDLVYINFNEFFALSDIDTSSHP